MNTWFECKAKYQKIGEDGKEKNVSEVYLVDAVSFTEAEARINEELKPYIHGEFLVVTIKIANFSELVPNEEGDRWFKCKVSFISIDEERGVERRSNTYMLAQADNVKEAYDLLGKYLEDTMSDYEIPSIQESPIVDVFTYEINGDLKVDVDRFIEENELEVTFEEVVLTCESKLTGDVINPEIAMVIERFAERLDEYIKAGLDWDKVESK